MNGGNATENESSCIDSHSASNSTWTSSVANILFREGVNLPTGR